VIAYQDQAELKHWFFARNPIEHTDLFVCLGSRNSAGDLLGVVGYDRWTGASCEMHFVGSPGWLTRRFMWAAFDYPFNQAECNLVLGRISSHDRHAISVACRIGFEHVFTLPDVYTDGHEVVLRMYKSQCKWLEYHHVEEVKAAASA
jgi:hypothetical protein